MKEKRGREEIATGQRGSSKGRGKALNKTQNSTGKNKGKKMADETGKRETRREELKAGKRNKGGRRVCKNAQAGSARGRRGDRSRGRQSPDVPSDEKQERRGKPATGTRETYGSNRWRSLTKTAKGSRGKKKQAARGEGGTHGRGTLHSLRTKQRGEGQEGL